MQMLGNSPAARTALLSVGVVLKQGQSVVKGGEKGETIYLDVAEIYVPPHGMVVLQTADKSRIGVISFTDVERGTVIIHVRGQRTYPIPSGEQIVVEVPADYTASRNDSINRTNPFDRTAGGVDSINRTDPYNTSAGHNISVNRTDPYNTIANLHPFYTTSKTSSHRDYTIGSMNPNAPENETLRAAVSVNEKLPQVMKAVVKMPEEVPKELIWNTTYHHFRYWLPIHKDGAIGGAEGCNTKAASTGKLFPISFVTPEATAFGNVRLTPGSNITQIGDSSYCLYSGSALIDDNRSCSIVTQHGTVSAKKGAVAQVTVTPKVTYVRNFYDNGSHDVSTVVGNRKLELRPGQEAAIVNSPRAMVRNLVFDDDAARRDMNIVSVNPDRHVAISDFSHVNQMMCNPMLRSIRSSQSDKDKKLYKKLEKMAAVLTTVHDRTRAPYTVPYEPVVSEQVAAKKGQQGM